MGLFVMSILSKSWLLIFGISSFCMAMEPKIPVPKPAYSKENLHPISKFVARIFQLDTYRTERQDLRNRPTSLYDEENQEFNEPIIDRTNFLRTRIKSLHEDVQHFTSLQTPEVQKSLAFLSRDAIKYNQAFQTKNNVEIQKTKKNLFKDVNIQKNFIIMLIF